MDQSYVLLVETCDWGVQRASRYAGWQLQRFGAAAPDALIELLKRAGSEVIAACGLSSALFRRERWHVEACGAYRQALHF